MVAKVFGVIFSTLLCGCYDVVGGCRGVVMRLQRFSESFLSHCYVVAEVLLCCCKCVLSDF